MRSALKALLVTAALALGVVTAAPGAGAQQEADGLVVVQIDDTNVNVTVPINAAIGIAANVCGVVVDANVLAVVDEGDNTVGPIECESRSPVFAGQDLTITNN